MKQNLGKLDRVLRFALAFWWLGPWAPRFTERIVNNQVLSWPIWANWLIIIVGVIALIESFLGWCWLHQLLNISNKN